MLPLLKLAGKVAKPKMPKDIDTRSFLVGCIGIRSDGTLISSRNGNVRNLFSKGLNPEKSVGDSSYHAEGRACKKIDKGATLYVARVSRLNGSYCISMPCHRCRALIRAKGVVKVYYTISHDSYGVWYPQIEAEPFC